MKRFGESILYKIPDSFFQRVRFFLFGLDFIGAAIRLAHFKKALKTIPSFSQALDAGCGTGDFSFYLAERYPKAMFDACDMNKKILQQNVEIQKSIGIANVSFFYADLLKFEEKEKYDFIFSIGTLIYFSKQDTKRILQRLTAALQKNGYLYLDLPQEDFLEVKWFPVSWYKEKYQALKSENSGSLYTFEEMQALLSECGYEIILANKSFSYAGKLAWEFDNVLRNHGFVQIRYFFVPFLKFFAVLDATTKHKKGCCFVILARKR